jgi:hypothetical protein
MPLKGLLSEMTSLKDIQIPKSNIDTLIRKEGGGMVVGEDVKDLVSFCSVMTTSFIFSMSEWKCDKAVGIQLEDVRKVFMDLGMEAEFEDLIFKVGDDKNI